jgi:group I intron endonuclease|nr:MAG TPA: intron associated endonuclease [Caudoviricetes sp.]
MNIDFGMEKYVYKIENKINKKIYVGQTNNLDRRMQEHKHDERNNHPIHNAIKKYGWENFEVSVLYYGVNYNEKEKEYIKLYKSNRKEYGYNITAGGQDSSGENNPQSKLSQSDVYQIISDLKGNNSIECIAKKYRTTVKTIRNINAGISWRIGSLQYPIRKRKLKILNNEEVKEIISLLKDANNSIEGIADMFNIKPYIVLNINKGNTYRLDSEIYPIREIGIPGRDIERIVEMLEQENIPIKEIAEKFNKTLSQIYRINKGECWHNDSLKYPIRKMTVERNELGQYKCGNLLLTQMEA